MRLHRSGTPRVKAAEAHLRVLEYMLTKSLAQQNNYKLFRAQEIAGVVWPGHDMRAQGAGGAASRILKRMADNGWVRWTVEQRVKSPSWGWTLTYAGRKLATEVVNRHVSRGFGE